MRSQVKEPRRFSFGNVLTETKLVFANRSFVILFLGASLTSLEVYINVYFWGLLPEQIAWFGPFLLVGAESDPVFLDTE